MRSTRLTGWRSQYQHMQRVYTRLSTPYECSIDYDDDLGHFFQDCWHLKDWLINDPSLSLAKSVIEKEVDAYKALMMAADLANARKQASGAAAL